MKTLIKNGRLLQGNQTLVAGEIWIEAGRIHAIGQAFDEILFDQVYDAKGGLISAGLVDVHVHLREPGFTEKETIRTGTLAAARGGFTTVCAMPNVSPVPDTPEKLKAIYQRIEETAAVHVYQYAPITKSLTSKEQTDKAALQKAGAFAFTNDGVGVQDAGTMYLAMQEAAALQMPIVAHTEDESLLFGGVMHEGARAQALQLPGIKSSVEAAQIARDVILAQETGVHYHVCHVSAKESVAVIRAAKQAGIRVSAEVTPHHLLLTDAQIPEDHGFWKMNPPLRGKADQEALIAGLLDGTIDCIATDHAPHELAEKQKSFREAPFGIVGSETAFALLYTQFVETGRFTLKQLLDWLTVKPATLFGLPAGCLRIGAPADLAVFDLTREAAIEVADFESLGKNTPFADWRVKGQTLLTFVSGRCVWKKGE